MKETVKLIAFDADDTLWVNEPDYRGAEQAYVEILSRYVDHHDLAQRLYQTEIKNLNLFGYGAKGYMLSMIETALELTQYQIDGRDIDRIIQLGKAPLLFPGIQRFIQGDTIEPAKKLVFRIILVKLLINFYKHRLGDIFGVIKTRCHSKGDI